MNEITNTAYYFNANRNTDNQERYRKATDYAKCQGVYVNQNKNDRSQWLLRSPQYIVNYPNDERFIYTTGHAAWDINTETTSRTQYGVVPTMNVRVIG